MIRLKELDNQEKLILVPPQGDCHSYFVIYIRSIILYLSDYHPFQKVLVGIINKNNQDLIDKYKFIKDMGLDFVNLSDFTRIKCTKINFVFHINDYETWIYLSQFRYCNVSFYTDGCAPYLDENHINRLVKYLKYSEINNLNYYIFPAANLYYFWWLSCIFKKNYFLNYIDEYYLYNAVYLFSKDYKFSIKNGENIQNTYVIVILLRPNSNLKKVVNELVRERINTLNFKNKKLTILFVPDNRIENINLKDLCFVKNVNIIPLNKLLDYKIGTPFEYIYNFFSYLNIRINEIICLDGKFVFNYISMPNLFKSTSLIFGLPTIENNLNDLNDKEYILKMINNIKLKIKSIKNLKFKKISKFLIMIENNL